MSGKTVDGVYVLAHFLVKGTPDLEILSPNIFFCFYRFLDPLNPKKGALKKQRFFSKILEN